VAVNQRRGRFQMAMMPGEIRITKWLVSDRIKWIATS
jgi:hypothetical protein